MGRLSTVRQRMPTTLRVVVVVGILGVCVPGQSRDRGHAEQQKPSWKKQSEHDISKTKSPVCFLECWVGQARPDSVGGASEMPPRVSQILQAMKWRKLVTAAGNRPAPGWPAAWFRGLRAATAALADFCTSICPWRKTHLIAVRTVGSASSHRPLASSPT